MTCEGRATPHVLDQINRWKKIVRSCVTCGSLRIRDIRADFRWRIHMPAYDSFCFPAPNRFLSSLVIKSIGRGTFAITAGVLSIWSIFYCHVHAISYIVIVLRRKLRKQSQRICETRKWARTFFPFTSLQNFYFLLHSRSRGHLKIFEFSCLAL